MRSQIVNLRFHDRQSADRINSADQTAECKAFSKWEFEDKIGNTEQPEASANQQRRQRSATDGEHQYGADILKEVAFV